MKLIRSLFCVLLILSLVLCLFLGENISRFASRKYAVRGADVSQYQGSIDWNAFSDELDFVFLKATEGSSHVDALLQTNRSQASETNLAVGFYHFFSFESPGQAQAEHFIQTVGSLSGCLPPVVDAEFYGGRHPDQESLLRELTAFMAAVENEYGVKPIVYTTGSFYRTYLKDRLNGYPLWIRNVYTVPERGWTFWQYSDLGRYPFYDGEEKHLDLNVFSGSSEELNALLLP